MRLSILVLSSAALCTLGGLACTAPDVSTAGLGRAPATSNGADDGAGDDGKGGASNGGDTHDGDAHDASAPPRADDASRDPDPPATDAAAPLDAAPVVNSTHGTGGLDGFHEL